MITHNNNNPLQVTLTYRTVCSSHSNVSNRDIVGSGLRRRTESRGRWGSDRGGRKVGTVGSGLLSSSTLLLRLSTRLPHPGESGEEPRPSGRDLDGRVGSQFSDGSGHRQSPSFPVDLSVSTRPLLGREVHPEVGRTSGVGPRPRPVSSVPRPETERWITEDGTDGEIWCHSNFLQLPRKSGRTEP